MDRPTSLSPRAKCKSTNGDGCGDIALERHKVLGLGRLGRVHTLGGVLHAPTQVCHGFIEEVLFAQDV